MTAPLVVVDADVLGRRRTGDERYVENLLRELGAGETGFALAAVTRRPELVPAGIAPVAFPAGRRSIRAAVRLPALLRRLSPAVAHFQYVVPPTYSGTAVVTVHDLSFEAGPGLIGRRDGAILRALVPRSVKRAARVLTVSEWTKADLVARYHVPDWKVVVTPNGVDPVFGPDGPARNGSPYMLFVGKLESRKDPLTAVRALARASRDLRLLFAGPEQRGGAAVRAEAERLGLGKRVELLGYVGDGDLAALYRGASCLVLPSRFEGFGLPVLEAMACGTPVVAGRAGAVPEVAGDAAVLVEPGDPEALVEGIERALGDAERLRRAGLARARAFRWTDTARATLGVYRELA